MPMILAGSSPKYAPAPQLKYTPAPQPKYTPAPQPKSGEKLKQSFHFYKIKHTHTEDMLTTN